MSEIFTTSKIPYTSFIVKTTTISELTRTNKIWEGALRAQLKDVVLSQSPRETLNLDVILHCGEGKRDDKYLGKYLYTIVSQLSFQNNLHEFNQNYVYEVLCEYSRGITEPNVRLFTFFQKRTSIDCKAVKQSCLTSNLLEHECLYFYIRRHNVEFCENRTQQCINYKWLQQEIPANAKLCVNDEYILVHKFLLAHKSTVFKAMFANEMTEAETGVVHIDDFSVDVIKEMVNFIYTGQVGNIKEMRYELYKAAHKYQLHDLCLRCIECILFNSDLGNIAETLDLACLYDIKELKESAFNFVKNLPKEMSKEPSYQDYMCRTMNTDNVVDRLLFSRLYDIEKVSETALDYIGENYCKMKQDPKFNELFKLNPILMREIFHHYCDKYAGEI